MEATTGTLGLGKTTVNFWGQWETGLGEDSAKFWVQERLVEASTEFWLKEGAEPLRPAP